jgi:integrase
MRVELKGIHAVPMRLKSGREVTYYYAWRGGPRLTGEPGSPEFMASYQAAYNTRKQPKADTLHSIIVAFKESLEFTRLGERTKSDYLKDLAKIEREFGDLPLDALDDPRVTHDFLRWRDRMAKGQPKGRQAQGAWSMLMRLLNWSRGRGLTTYRTPERVDRIYKADRSEKIWLDEDISVFMSVAQQPLQRALVLAIETGQRQGDLLGLPWSAYDGSWIRLRQRKSMRPGSLGRKVNIPVTKRLNAVLATTPKTSPVILTHARGRPWTANAFRKAWGLATRKAVKLRPEIEGLTFHDLRGTAVTRLSEAGCTPQEIATITGHSLADVEAILEKYLARTDKLAIAAIAKLERGRKRTLSVKRPVKGSSVT